MAIRKRMQQVCVGFGQSRKADRVHEGADGRGQRTVYKECQKLLKSAIPVTIELKSAVVCALRAHGAIVHLPAPPSSDTSNATNGSADMTESIQRQEQHSLIVDLSEIPAPPPAQRHARRSTFGKASSNCPPSNMPSTYICPRTLSQSTRTKRM
jgi:hypothetical protein